jgi:hypothetical protein
MIAHIRIAMLAATGIAGVWLTSLVAQQGGRVAIDADDVGGIVTSAKGPEAGVWVIAETTDLSTKFTRIVVTDDQGRYVLPDMPRGATYQVFVRGYGLVDSPRVQAKPGQQLDLKAVVAPDAKAAAQVYPAAYWMAMMVLPEGAKEQEHFQQTLRGCYDCHELGSKATREMHPAIAKQAASSLDAWDRRTRVGPAGPSMSADFQELGEHRKSFAEWTDRIAAGEVPKVAPPRPSGVARNLVVTLWDWGSPVDARSDSVASNKHSPGVNGNGPIYGVSQMTDSINVLDPLEHKASIVKVPSRGLPATGFATGTVASPYWAERLWQRTSDPRSIEIDVKGRVWLTVNSRDPKQQPAWCAGAGANAYGKNYPLRTNGRQAAIFNPGSGTFDVIDTCFRTDHNEFSHDNFVYYGTNDGVGWIDMNMWDKTHDAEKSQGWCPGVVDTNGDGKITEWTEPDQPIDPKKDHRISFGCYSIAINEKDGSLWCSATTPTERKLTRIEKGSNPPVTCRAEYFEPPKGQTPELVGTGGLVADRNGVIHQNWRVSGHFTLFDRTRCKSTRDPQATGQSCPEGWTIYRNPNTPSYSNSVYHAAEAYLNHLDSEDVLGLGKDSSMYGGYNTSSMEVLSSTTKQFVTLRVPYPMGFMPRSATIRIDDPNAGWKGKGLWSSYSTFTNWHLEGGRGTKPKVVKFQMRPSPLAK